MNEAQAPDTVLLVRSGDFRWEAIASVVRRTRTLSVIGDTTGTEEALRMACKLLPSLVLLGAEISAVDIVDFAARLRAAAGPPKIVVFGDELDHALFLALGRVPVDAYVLYSELSPAVIATTLQTVMLGLRIASAAVADEVLARPQAQHHPGLDALRLTGRERAVLHWLGEGLTERKIAEIEGVRERTVQRRVATLLDKFGTTCILQLRMLAYDRRY